MVGLATVEQPIDSASSELLDASADVCAAVGRNATSGSIMTASLAGEPQLGGNGGADLTVSGDGAVASAVRERLRGSHYLSLRRIDCECLQGVVTLRGRLPRYYLMQVLQLVVEQVRGVDQVLNLVEVTPSPPR